MYDLIIVERVYVDLNDAALWYEVQQIGLGKDLVFEFKKAVEALVSNPLGYEKKFKQFRHTMLKRFPFILIFEVENNEIVIHRFINIKQQPSKRYKGE